MNKIGSNIRALRRTRDMTQDYLAKKVGKRANTVCEWEKGRRRVTVNDLIIISDVFEVTLDELVKGSLRLEVST